MTDWSAVLEAIRAADADLRTIIDIDPGTPPGEGPLSDLRIGIKGNVAVRGLPNTAGSAARRHAKADTDAAVTALLRGAGAVIVGTLNMHEGALGATTDNPAYGRCINPWAAGHSPGGSSGGSGAAVAAGLVDAAIGSDTLGSIRLPAAYCGVFGWKPSGRLVPQDGAIPLAHSLDQVGPLARDAETLVRVAKVLGASEPLADLSGLRLGAPLGWTRIDPAVQALFEAACDRLRARGVTIVPVDFALRPTVIDVILAALLVCEIEGAEEWAAELDDPQSGLGDDFRAMLEYGRRASPESRANARMILAETRDTIRSRLAQDGLDGFVTPTTSHIAFHHDTGPPLDQAYLTMWANIADLPACSAPMGLVDSPAGPLPAGFQIVARPGREDIALGVACAFDALDFSGVRRL